MHPHLATRLTPPLPFGILGVEYDRRAGSELPAAVRASEGFDRAEDALQAVAARAGVNHGSTGVMRSVFGFGAPGALRREAPGLGPVAGSHVVHPGKPIPVCRQPSRSMATGVRRSCV